MWEELMKLLSSSGNTIGAATQGPTLGQKLASGVNMGMQFMDMAGPNGSLTRGNLVDVYKGGKGMYDNYNQITMSPEARKEAMMKQHGITSTAPSPGVQGSPDVLGRGTQASFAAMTPDVQKEIMKILLGKK